MVIKYINEKLKFNDINYELSLTLKKYSIIQEIDYHIDGDKKFKDNFLNKDINELIFSDSLNKTLKIDDIIFYYLLKNKSIIKADENQHCKCLGMTRSEVCSYFNQASKLSDVVKETGLSSTCTQCLEDSIKLWCECTQSDPLLSLKKYNKIDEINMLEQIENYLTSLSFDVYRLAFPMIYLKPLSVISGSYIDTVKELEKAILNNLNLQLKVSLVF